MLESVSNIPNIYLFKVKRLTLDDYLATVLTFISSDKKPKYLLHIISASYELSRSTEATAIALYSIRT